MAGFPIEIAQIAVKAEGTEGTAEVLTNAEAAIQARNLTPIEPDIPFIERDIVSASHDQFPGISGGPRTYTLNFDVPLFGSGAAGTAPSWGPLLIACGFSETIVGSTSVTYKPAVGSGSVTLAWYVSGMKFLMHGARGKVDFKFNNGEIPIASFSFMGAYNLPTDTSLLASITYEATGPVALLGGAFTLDSTVLRFREFGISVDNGLSIRDDTTKASGVLSCMIGKRRITGAIDPEWELAATYDFFTKVTSNSEGALSLPIGATAGNITTVTAPKVQYKAPKPKDRDDYLAVDLDLQFNRNSGDDCLVIALT